MSRKGQYRKIPEFSLKFLVVISNVYPESTYWVQTLHGWILVTRMGYVFEEVQCRMNIQGFFPKIVKNFKRMTAEHETKHEILLSEGTWVSTWVVHPWCRSCLQYPCEKYIPIHILHMKKKKVKTLTVLPACLKCYRLWTVNLVVENCGAWLRDFHFKSL